MNGEQLRSILCEALHDYFNKHVEDYLRFEANVSHLITDDGFDLEITHHGKEVTRLSYFTVKYRGTEEESNS